MSDTQTAYITVNPFTPDERVLYGNTCGNCGATDTGETVDTLLVAMSAHLCEADTE